MRSDSGEPSKPDRFASTTTGRLPLAALIARAIFFDDSGNSVPGRPLVGTVGRQEAGRGSGRDSMPRTRHRLAAEVGVQDHRRVGVRHPRPALERRVVLVDRRAHQRADVERLLALGVALGGEDVADRGEAAPTPACGDARTSRSTGSVVGARRGNRSPGAT